MSIKKVTNVSIIKHYGIEGAPTCEGCGVIFLVSEPEDSCRFQEHEYIETTYASRVFPGRECPVHYDTGKAY